MHPAIYIYHGRRHDFWNFGKNSSHSSCVTAWRSGHQDWPLMARFPWCPFNLLACGELKAVQCSTALGCSFRYQPWGAHQLMNSLHGHLNLCGAPGYRATLQGFQFAGMQKAQQLMYSPHIDTSSCCAAWWQTCHTSKLRYDANQPQRWSMLNGQHLLWNIFCGWFAILLCCKLAECVACYSLPWINVMSLSLSRLLLCLILFTF